MFVQQLQLGPMENFVYLLGPDEGQELLVVDPAWDVPAIEAAAQAAGRRIAGVFVSHHHGDHTNGLPELLGRHDVPVYVQREELAFSPSLRPFTGALRPIGAGETISLGTERWRALHTPGHTPGSQCLFTGEAVVSGDTLFVDHCGRCDLPGGDPEAMFHSLRRLVTELPEGTRLLPGHDYGEVPVSTLAREKTHNPYLKLEALPAFLAFRMRPRK